MESSSIRRRHRLRIGLLMLFLSVPAIAQISESELQQLVGYTVVGVFTITGWRDTDGSGENDTFKGCTFGRIIIFEGDKALKCAEYGYQYAYRPDAVIFVNGSVFKMLVDGQIYDMQN